MSMKRGRVGCRALEAEMIKVPKEEAVRELPQWEIDCIWKIPPNKHLA